jgi:hypothetical protein
MASGGIDHFEPSREEKSTWLLRLQSVMACQKITVPEENQRECLVGHLGGKAVEWLKAQVYPSHPLDKTFQQLKEVLLEIYTPTRFFGTEQRISTDRCTLLKKASRAMPGL